MYLLHGTTCDKNHVGLKVSTENTSQTVTTSYYLYKIVTTMNKKVKKSVHTSLTPKASKNCRAEDQKEDYFI